MKEFQEAVVKTVENKNIKWQRHSFQRMMERGISRKDVKQVLQKGELIEYYPDDFPLPSGLFLGFPENNGPLHVVAAVDNEKNYSYIVTAYRPDTDHFESDYKTRK